MAKDFSHLDETGGISMVHVGAKKSTQREAVAAATVRMTPATLQKLVERALPKGDVLTTAKVAGVLAAKQTPSLIPLAHPLALDSVDITFDLDPAAGTIGAGLRAGDGATNAVTDKYGRVLVTDSRGGELLVYKPDTLVELQRYPVPGAPYGITYDPAHDLAWVTLTATNQVVGYDIAGGEPVERHRLNTVRQPDSVAVDPNTGRVLVASADGGGVQVITP